MTRRNRTISETTFATEDGQQIDFKIDVGEPEPFEDPDHYNVVSSVDIREGGGTRTVMDNAHVDW